MRLERVKAAIVLAACALAAPAAAHVAPSPDVNNRYLKATLLPDRLRVTYTLLIGDRPGAGERRRMDRDGDGRLSAAERAAFGARMTEELGAHLSILLDGKPVGDWRLVDVGLGQAVVGTLPVAVDLELDAPYANPAADEHTLFLDDVVKLPLPGEVELRIDESPGVRVLESHLASERSGIELRFVFEGNSPLPGERAVTARFSVDQTLRVVRARRRGVAVAIWLGLAAVGLLAVAVARRRRKAKATT